MPIRLLSPDVVAKIAAGEVIERPASVVKELVENSLDGGARQIYIEIEAGGVECVRVSDDGGGIPSAEVPLVLQRHATSKLTSLADLESITTLGFRGEALASIAAVADVEIVTRISGDDEGVRLCWKDGLAETSPAARSPGTTVTVRRLFRGFPARLKFLKSEASERGHVISVVNHYAMSFPEVRFSVSADGRLALSTPGSGNLRDVVAEVYGLGMAREVLDIRPGGQPGDQAPFEPGVSGLVGLPSVARSNRAGMSFFVNRRWVQSRLLSRATEEGYQGSLQVGRFPVAIINVVLPPTELDVNVHPAKTEVKFRSEGVVFGSVMKAVRQTLLARPVPVIAPHQSASLPHPLPQPIWPEGHMEQHAVPVAPAVRAGARLPILRVLGQAAGTYIVAEGPEGLYLIDQHAAHERVLYEDILSQHSRRAVEKQGFLEPVALEFGYTESETLRTKASALTEFGFEIEPFGGKGYVVRAVPAMLKKADLILALRDLISALDERKTIGTPWERLALSLACHGAVRAGQTLAMDEMQELVYQLERTAMPRTCPHGRPTMLHLSSQQLEKEFGRT